MRSRKSESLRIIVVGYLLRGPLGGQAWHHAQYVKGLALLGHDVYYVEDSHDRPFCYHPWTETTDTDPTEGLQFTERTFARLGLDDRWGYHDAHTSRWFGPCADRILRLCRSADVLLNLAGQVNPMRPWFVDIPTRVFLDVDPAFTQVLHLTDPSAKTAALKHTAFFSYAENIGRPGCTIPDDGLPWQATRQPVILDAWPVKPGRPTGKFTTVMCWYSYPTKEYAGVRYGLKSDSFGPYFDLPRRAGSVLELAVRSIPALDFEKLRSGGWALVDGRESSRDLEAYQAYIQNSKAEFSVAKHAYVITRSGWSSDRSAVYLASGRPVVLQETGFSDWLPTGLGVLAFNNPDEAVAAIEDVNTRYELHCRAAREIAAEYFDFRKVLPAMIEKAMSPRQRDAR